MTIYTFDASKIQEDDVQIFKLSKLKEGLNVEIPDDTANQHIEVSIYYFPNQSSQFVLHVSNIFEKARYVVLNKIPASAKVGEPALVEEDLIPSITAIREEERKWYRKRQEELKKQAEERTAAREAARMQESVTQESIKQESAINPNTTIKQEPTPNPESDENEGLPPLVPIKELTPDPSNEEDRELVDGPPPLILTARNQESRLQTPEAESDSELVTSASNTQQKIKRQRGEDMDSVGDDDIDLNPSPWERVHGLTRFPKRTS